MCMRVVTFTRMSAGSSRTVAHQNLKRSRDVGQLVTGTGTGIGSMGMGMDMDYGYGFENRLEPFFC